MELLTGKLESLSSAEVEDEKGIAPTVLDLLNLLLHLVELRMGARPPARMHRFRPSGLGGSEHVEIGLDGVGHGVEHGGSFGEAWAAHSAGVTFGPIGDRPPSS